MSDLNHSRPLPRHCVEITDYGRSTRQKMKYIPRMGVANSVCPRDTKQRDRRRWSMISCDA